MVTKTFRKMLVNWRHNPGKVTLEHNSVIFHFTSFEFTD